MNPTGQSLTVEQAITLARSQHRNGDLAAAESIYRQILAQFPAHHEAMHLLGVAIHQSGNHMQARELIARSIALCPENPDYHHNYAEVCIAVNLLAEAEQASRRAAALAPDRADHLVTLSRVLRELGRIDEAIAAGRRALELDSNHSGGHLNLANALGDARQFEPAIESYQRALMLSPGDPQVISSMGTTLAEMGRIDEAIATFGMALEKTEHADAHWNRSLMLLLRGDLERGFEELEWRWKCSKFPSARLVTSKPQWNGTNAPGKTILLFGEQGAGDTIQFIRYAPLVAERAGRTVLACAPELLPLLRNAPGVHEVVGIDQVVPSFDQHIPLLSLPRVFKTRMETIPAPVPYLRADPERIARWGQRLTAPGRKIGLAWAGRPSHPNDRNRSMKLSDLAALAKVPDVQWISLQVGAAAAEAASPPDGMRLLDLSGEIRDYADTAAIIDNLDLLISVDTSVVHVAGALGKPAWVLLPFVPDWRWLLDRDDSPWYPTIQLFRQPAIGDWPSVIHRVAKRLYPSL